MQEHLIEESNLAVAWAKAFVALMEPGCKELAPLTVRIHVSNERPAEHPIIRSSLDSTLRARGEQSCNTVAGTIFPNSMWNPNLPNNAEALYERYRRAWPGIKRCQKNRLGVYFQRLIAFQPEGAPGHVNQLDRIIRIYRDQNCHRRSALQASLLDPTRDLSASRVRGFPCMQQIAFTPHEGDLEVVAFYPLQYHFEKSYGNYLGLCHLGRFMARQMGLRFTTLTCFASVLARGQSSKQDLASLAHAVRGVLESEQFAIAS